MKLSFLFFGLAAMVVTSYSAPADPMVKPARAAVAMMKAAPASAAATKAEPEAAKSKSGTYILDSGLSPPDMPTKCLPCSLIP